MKVLCPRIQDYYVYIRETKTGDGAVNIPTAVHSPFEKLKGFLSNLNRFRRDIYVNQAVSISNKTKKHNIILVSDQRILDTTILTSFRKGLPPTK